MDLIPDNRISTNWKERYYDRFKPETFNEKEHVEARAVIDFMVSNDLLT